MIFPQGTLHNADALTVMSQMADDSVDMVFTDPPYKTISGGVTSKAGREYGWDKSVLSKNDGKIFKHNKIKPSEYMGEIARVLKPSGHCYVMINRINLLDLLLAAKDAKLSFANTLFWGKGRKNANRMYMLETEIVCMFYKKPAIKIDDCGSSQIYFCPTVTKAEKSHQTEKPSELIEHYILNSSKPNDVIFDPFAGVGSTAIAAIRTGRQFICCELDAEYYFKSCGRVWGELKA